MELYPVKKFMKEYESRSYNSNSALPQPIIFKSSRAISSKDEFLKQFYSQKGNQKRFDRDFTLSWANKHDGKPQNNKEFFPVSRNKSQSHINPCVNSPLNSNRPSIVPQHNHSLTTHFSDNKDAERLKVKMYAKEEVYGLRQQNQEGVAQTLNAKKQAEQEFNHIAQLYSVKGYRSEPLNFPGNGLSKSCALTPRDNKGTCQTSPDDSRTMDSFNTALVSQLTGTTLTKSLFCEAGKEKPTILEDLEEMYFNDVKKETAGRLKTDGILDSPYNKEAAKKKRLLKKALSKSDYKDLLEDDTLFKKLEDPYGKNLPFENPVNGHILDKKSSKLKELEVKIGVLRNIKALTGEINSSPSSTKSEKSSKFFQLPQIKTLSESNFSPKAGSLKAAQRIKSRSVYAKEKIQVESPYYLKGDYKEYRDTMNDDD